MGQTTYSNQEVSESTTAGAVTITLARKSRAIEIINDTLNEDLEYKFGSRETYSTLKPQEAISLDFITKTILLNSPSANTVTYRVRVMS